jgi:hypothetical protein
MTDQLLRPTANPSQYEVAQSRKKAGRVPWAHKAMQDHRCCALEVICVGDISGSAGVLDRPSTKAPERNSPGLFR